jgi:DNA-binding protein H-NS
MLEGMTINMDDQNIATLDQLKEFLKLNHEGLKFQAISRKEKYLWLENTLTKFGYFSLTKKDKSAVKKYIKKMTGLSKSQTKKLIAKKKKSGHIICGQKSRHKFGKKYGAGDIALLAKTDNLHGRLSGQATKTILQREYGIFKKVEYKNISQISVSHIYNLRGTRFYFSRSITVGKTQATKSAIGERRKPDPRGMPGFIRVDTCHQGNKGDSRGIYHINLLDEVTQWELIGAVSAINIEQLKPLLEILLNQFPFVIINFHSDNGSEYINKMVAGLLNKLLISQTKSRARHCNDNAPVECKNYCIIRKNLTYFHIAKEFANDVDDFYQEIFNEYLNYHRPCGYAATVTKANGKEVKKYHQKDYKMPYEKLKSLPDANQYLKLGITFKMLDKIAYRQSDNEAAEAMQKTKEILFSKIKNQTNSLLFQQTTEYVNAVAEI